MVMRLARTMASASRREKRCLRHLFTCTPCAAPSAAAGCARVHAAYVRLRRGEGRSLTCTACLQRLGPQARILCTRICLHDDDSEPFSASISPSTKGQGELEAKHSQAGLAMNTPSTYKHRKFPAVRLSDMSMRVRNGVRICMLQHAVALAPCRRWPPPTTQRDATLSSEASGSACAIDY